MVEVDVLHHGRRRHDENARNRRDRRRQRPDDRKTQQLRRHDLRHQLRDYTVHPAEGLCVHAEHAAPENADEIHGDVHKGNHNRPDDHGTVHVSAAAVADAAHDRLRQRNRECAHEQPLRNVERDRHASRRRRRQHLRMGGAQLREDRLESAARLKHIVKEQNDTKHHHNRTARIRQGDGTKPAD